jgi:isocitrate dehydrogenase
MMLDFMGWKGAANRLRSALQNTIKDGVVTYDLARQIPGAQEVSCSAFAAAIVDRL